MPDKPATSRLTLAVDRKSDVTVVRCNGRLVAGVCEGLYREVSQLTPDSKHIVLDFKELTHLDSMGIGTLVRLYVHCKSAGCVFELMNVGPPVRQLLGITHLLSVFQLIGESNIRIG